MNRFGVGTQNQDENNRGIWKAGAWSKRDSDQKQRCVVSMDSMEPWPLVHTAVRISTDAAIVGS